ncbi:MAG: PIN domain-containing protein [Chloroflexi bacterium]|nr:PIN domain-containing protein [Chloroflexota bacterium]
MSIHTLLRLAVMLVLGYIGWEGGVALTRWLGGLEGWSVPPELVRWLTTLGAALLGYAVGPALTIRPARAIGQRLQRVPARTLLTGALGLVIGLLVAALLALPLSMLPGAFGRVLPFAAAVALGTLGATLMVSRERDILGALGLVAGRDTIKRRREAILLDTSVIIDGRIADICATGFLSGSLLTPRFVLEELQHIADSPDPLRRRRGRRGLDVLERLRTIPHVTLETTSHDPAGVPEVDAKLIAVAIDLDCAILTNDYNLNRVAALQRVRVLNVNELANAVKSVVLPGEPLTVQIIQEGKEPGQGVGYLDDGTMVVVEEGRRYLHTTCDVLVTRVLQTVAGKMIFAQMPQRANGKESQ